MKLPVNILCMFVVLTALGGGAAPIPPTPKEVQFFFPTEVGAKWLYKVGNREDTLVVTHVDDQHGAKLVSVSRVEGKKTVQAMKVLVSEKGLYEVEVVGTVFDPPRCVLRLPAKRGDSW